MVKAAFQNYIEANLPDRFKQMKVFRIPVSYNDELYWAAYKAGEWDFQPATGNLTPLISYTCVEDVGMEEEETPIKERPVKPEKKVKERPVKEKPVKEKPVKEKKVKERPAKEKKVVQRPQPDENDFSMADFDGPMPSFVKDKPIKKLTGRIVFNVIFLICSLGTMVFISLPVIINASKANKNLNNPIEYWHYRSKTTYLHVIAVLTLIEIILIAIAIASSYAMIMGIIAAIAGGM